jgi:hypothetical protein
MNLLPSLLSPLLLPLLLLAGCSITPQVPADVHVYEQERFSVDSPYQRVLGVPPQSACDAARRVLLGQGYALHQSEPERLHARKFFKPVRGASVELAVNVLCLPPAPRDGSGSLMFITAWQDEFVTRRNPVAASIGVPVVGNVSMPVGSTEDSLVKVAVETIQDRAFYERFFAQLERTLAR